jgi:molybdate transport system permease protein
MPLAVYLELAAGHPEAAVALSLVLLLVSLATLLLLRERWLGRSDVPAA